MTMKVNIKDQYIDKFEDFMKSLPEDAIEVCTINDNSISFEESKQKVQRAINNIPSDKGLDLDSAFEKVMSY